MIGHYGGRGGGIEDSGEGDGGGKGLVAEEKMTA